MRGLIPWLLLLFLTLASALGEDGFRIWTDLANNQVEAAFESAEGNQVRLRMKGGQFAVVPLDGLSPADQTWIRERQSPASQPSIANTEPSPSPVSANTGGRPPYTGPAAEPEWPRIVHRPGAITTQVIREAPEKREFVYESDHFEFICDTKLSSSLVREFSEVFETTYYLNAILPLNLQPQPEPGRKKFLARIYTDENDYHKAGGPLGSGGVYIPGERAFLVPLRSLGVRLGNKVIIDRSAEDYRTLIHEVTHQVMNFWLNRIPLWYIEGAAECLEQTRYENGKFSFVKQDRDLAEYINTFHSSLFQMVALEKLLSIDHAEWQAALASGAATHNYTSAHLLTYYFYFLEGKGDAVGMKAFLKAVGELPRGGDFRPLVEQHLLRGRSPAELEEEVAKAYRRIGINIVFR